LTGPSQRPDWIGPAAAERILQRIDRRLTVQSIVGREEGAKADVLLVRCSDGRCLAIKAFRPAAEDRMAKEVFLYDRIARCEALPVPHVLGVDDSHESFPGSCMVMTALEGERLLDRLTDLADLEVAAIYRQIGAIQLELHRTQFERFGLLATDVLGGYGDNEAFMRARFDFNLAAFIELGGGARLAQAVAEHVDAHAELFARCTEPVLCHNDFHEANLLVTLDGGPQISGLFDFENALAGDPLLDLSKTHHPARRGSEQTLAALVEGYGGLPAGWRAAFDLYTLHHALELWTWFALGGSAAALPNLEKQMRELVGLPSGRRRLAAKLRRLGA
jgi:aminoglycoside phosphotransferase (APT) family kinase protein